MKQIFSNNQSIFIAHFLEDIRKEMNAGTMIHREQDEYITECRVYLENVQTILCHHLRQLHEHDLNVDIEIDVTSRKKYEITLIITAKQDTNIFNGWSCTYIRSMYPDRDNGYSYGFVLLRVPDGTVYTKGVHSQLGPGPDQMFTEIIKAKYPAFVEQVRYGIRNFKELGGQYYEAPVKGGVRSVDKQFREQSELINTQLIHVY